MSPHDEEVQSPTGSSGAEPGKRPFAGAVTVLTILGLLAALAVPLVASRFRASGAPHGAATPEAPRR